MTNVEGKSTVNIAAILTCRNRADMTNRVVRQLLSQAEENNLNMQVVVVDDGSSDDTVSRLAEFGAAVTIIQADGSLYWARGMALAEQHALASDELDYVLWINDDVDLFADALRAAVAEASGDERSVIVGATQSTSRPSFVTYSAMRWVGPHPLRYIKVDDLSSPGELDTFNGNFVLVRSDIARTVGGISATYSHSLADIDYGVRVKSLGFDIRLLDVTIGACDLNPARDLTFRQSWREFVGRKGPAEPQSLLYFLKLMRPITFGVWFMATYVTWFLKNVRLLRPGA